MAFGAFAIASTITLLLCVYSDDRCKLQVLQSKAESLGIRFHGDVRPKALPLADSRVKDSAKKRTIQVLTIRCQRGYADIGSQLKAPGSGFRGLRRAYKIPILILVLDTCDSARLDGTEEDNKLSILACKQAQSSLNLQWLGGRKIFAK